MGVLWQSTWQGPGIAAAVAVAGVNVVGVAVGVLRWCIGALPACMQSRRGCRQSGAGADTAMADGTGALSLLHSQLVRRGCYDLAIVIVQLGLLGGLLSF